VSPHAFLSRHETPVNDLGLYGICDAIEISSDTALAVEHKIGPYVPGGPADVQAAAQALCLTEMLALPVGIRHE